MFALRNNSNNICQAVRNEKDKSMILFALSF